MMNCEICGQKKDYIIGQFALCGCNSPSPAAPANANYLEVYVLEGNSTDCSEGWSHWYKIPSTLRDRSGWHVGNILLDDWEIFPVDCNNIVRIKSRLRPDAHLYLLDLESMTREEIDKATVSG